MAMLEFRKTGTPAVSFFEMKGNVIAFSHAWVELVVGSFKVEHVILIELLLHMIDMPNGGTWKAEVVRSKNVIIGQNKIGVEVGQISEAIHEIKAKRNNSDQARRLSEPVINLLRLIGKSV